ncbi:HPr family phosphocarrier protein [Laceyella putida]|uniref:Phosphocarrier protein HPr n=1 Tax=Laceyella putida TaxID=110101 RepID=A0ABW2RI72_9BACL
MHSSCCGIVGKALALWVGLSVCLVFIGDKMVSAQTWSPDEGRSAVGIIQKQEDVLPFFKKKDEKVSSKNEEPKAALSRTDPEEGIVIRAEHIEAQGLIPSLTTTENGRLAVRLFAKKAQIYDMALIVGKKSTPFGRWGMDIHDAGPVLIQGLVVDATALGFNIKGPPLELDKPLPAFVLYDVYLKVERMEADRVGMPQVDLQTKRDVSLSSDGPVIDMGRLPKAKGLKALTDTVNDLLASLSGNGSTEDPPGTRPDDPANQPPLPEEDPPRPPKKPPVPGPDPDPPLNPPNNLPKPPSLPPSDVGDVVDKGSVVKKVVVKLKDGLHNVLTVLQFVQQAEKYDHTEITIQKGNQKADAKNLSEVLSINLIPGTEIILIAEGKEAKQAVEALADFISKSD